jgi:hypothetical protein
MKTVLIPFLVGLVFMFSPGCENNDPGDNNRNVVGTGPFPISMLHREIPNLWY